MQSHSSQKTILVISNGETEDYLACQIIDKIPKDQFKFLAAPLVSHGFSYQKRKIPIICPTQSLPSRGFNNQSFKSFFKDLKSGLLTLTIRQLMSLRRTRNQYDYVFTCGDVLPQVFGYLTGKPFLSFFTALSEFYIRDKKELYSKFWRTLERKNLWHSSTFTVFDRALMHNSKCLGVFVRDDFTNNYLKPFTPKSYALGNPMMDGFEDNQISLNFNQKFMTIVLLPGSRTPEVYNNLAQMVGVIKEFKTKDYNIALNLTPQMNLKDCIEVTKDSPIQIQILEHSFSTLLNRANLALAMCGTAAEQAVGKGIPVVSMPGKGPQFISAFANRQQKLLGSSYFLVNNGSKSVAEKIELLLNESTSYQKNALERMGRSGGSQRIATKIKELIDDHQRSHRK